MMPREDAGVVELVDAPDSKSGSARSVGSIPTARTNLVQTPGGDAAWTFGCTAELP